MLDTKIFEEQVHNGSVNSPLRRENYWRNLRYNFTKTLLACFHNISFLHNCTLWVLILHFCYRIKTRVTTFARRIQLYMTIFFTYLEYFKIRWLLQLGRLLLIFEFAQISKMLHASSTWLGWVLDSNKTSCNRSGWISISFSS